MEKQWLITFRSVTYAQKAERLLKKLGIACTLQRTPKELSSRGCGYCLRMQGTDAIKAAQQLQKAQFLYEKIYVIMENGSPEERQL